MQIIGYVIGFIIGYGLASVLFNIKIKDLNSELDDLLLLTRKKDEN
jgi:hypothetical protein